MWTLLQRSGTVGANQLKTNSKKRKGSCKYTGFASEYLMTKLGEDIRLPVSITSVVNNFPGLSRRALISRVRKTASFKAQRCWQWQFSSNLLQRKEALYPLLLTSYCFVTCSHNFSLTMILLWVPTLEQLKKSFSILPDPLLSWITSLNLLIYLATLSLWLNCLLFTSILPHLLSGVFPTICHPIDLSLLNFSLMQSSCQTFSLLIICFSLIFFAWGQRGLHTAHSLSSNWL